MITLAGATNSANFPTTADAYDRTHNSPRPSLAPDAFLMRLDPARSAVQQLVYGTFLGGNFSDAARALHVDSAGVITLVGQTVSTDFPTTPGAFDTSAGGTDAFVARLDPSQPPAQQLRYSTYVGGNFGEDARAVVADGAGVVTFTGLSSSSDYPTTPGAFSRSHNRGIGFGVGDCVVTRLDPAQPGSAQLVYSTYFGGRTADQGAGLAVDPSGVVTVAGITQSFDMPVTANAFDSTYSGNQDVFVARLDPSLSGTSQLLYSTFLGGTDARGENLNETQSPLHVDPTGVITVFGLTGSADFPTTAGAFDRTMTGGDTDVFVSRLDPARTPSRQLLYSTFYGGSTNSGSTGELAGAMHVDPYGVATIVGTTGAVDLPTTPSAFRTTPAGGDRDLFVARLDLLPAGAATFGRASPGCDGLPAIGVTAMPQVGNADFAVTCNRAPPSALGALALSGAALSMPLVSSGVEVWIDPTDPAFLPLLTSSDGRGAGEVPLPVPADSGLVGAGFHCQYLWIGPTSPPPCPPLGLSMSNALTITVQP